MIWIKKPYKTINFKYGLSSTYKWYIKIKTIIFKNLYTVNLLTNNLIFKLNLEAKSEHSTSLKNDITHSQTLRDRNNHQRYSMKKVVLRNFAKFTGKHLCQSLFLNKVAGLRPAILLKKRQVFSCEFCEISKTTFSYRTPPVAASFKISESFFLSRLLLE